MFKTTGTINKAVLKEVINCASRGRYIFFTVAILLLCVSAFTDFAEFDLGSGTAKLMFGFICVFFVVMFIKRSENIFEKRLIESYGKPETVYSASFNEDCIVCEHLDSGGVTNIKYGSIARFCENKNHIFLFTHQNQYIVVFKDSLSEQERGELIAFLRQKPTCIKWKKSVR